MWEFALLLLFALTFTVSSSGSWPLRSFGVRVAVKSLKLETGNETTVFAYTLSKGAESGSVTQQWHGGHGTMGSACAYVH